METPPADTADVESSWHIYCLKVPERDDLCSFLQQKGIATGVHYTPIHLYSCYGNKPHLPVAEEVFKRIVSLPIYPDMTEAEIQFVIDSVSEYYVGAGFIGSPRTAVKLPQEAITEKRKRSAA